jgi:hypothetical protein
MQCSRNLANRMNPYLYSSTLSLPAMGVRLQSRRMCDSSRAKQSSDEHVNAHSPHCFASETRSDESSSVPEIGHPRLAATLRYVEIRISDMVIFVDNLYELSQCS